MLNKKYVVLIVIFLVFAGAYSWHQSKANEINNLSRYIEFSTIHYEAALCQRAISEIPDLLQKENFVKNCTEVKCTSSSKLANGATCKISSKFELPPDLKDVDDNKIIQTVKSFIHGINPGFTNDLKLNKAINISIEKSPNASPSLQVECSFSIDKK